LNDSDKLSFLSFVSERKNCKVCVFVSTAKSFGMKSFSLLNHETFIRCIVVHLYETLRLVIQNTSSCGKSTRRKRRRKLNTKRMEKIYSAVRNCTATKAIDTFKLSKDSSAAAAAACCFATSSEEYL